MFDVLLATDAPWTESSVRAALLEPDFTVRVVSEGRRVSESVTDNPPDLVILDLQAGNMGGVAVNADLENSLVDSIPVLLLLDREADSWLAKRFGAEAWLVKPISPAKLAETGRELIAAAG
ncbi:MAG: hypothetical protein DCC49_01820 [Acidobacteria bacterium]|nr:MAG: hypothetical protein DCC49_01820 [Acidobacteriota bacterium]